MIKLKEQSDNIEYDSKSFDIDPLKLKAITYVERTNNYDWRDEYFDNYLAKKGKNSSIGFCQVKMKTAYWIECQLTDSLSEFYPGNKYEKILTVSQSPQEIIDKLGDDRTNLLYASAYMRIIRSYWESKGDSIDNRVDIYCNDFFIWDIYNRFTLQYPINHE